jgi:hypothetical protein
MQTRVRTRSRATQIQRRAKPPSRATSPSSIRFPQPARTIPHFTSLTADLLLRRRGSAPLQMELMRQMQQTFGNHAVQRIMRRPPVTPPGATRRRSPALLRATDFPIQRISLNPLDWATNLLHTTTGDAEAGQAEVQNDATSRADELDSQGAARSQELQGESDTQAPALQGEADAQGGQLGQQSQAQGTALQGQANAQSQQLSTESTARASTLQQDASGTSTDLQTDVNGLESQTRSTTDAATRTVGADVTGMQGEAETTAGQLNGRWTEAEGRGSSWLAGMTSGTQSLVRQKTALVQEYQSPGQHDPEVFQKRWQTLQQQVGGLEQQESGLHAAEDSATAVSSQADSVWSRLSGRGHALWSRVGSLAEGAWGAFQSRWSALQAGAAKAIAGLRERAGAAVTALKSLTTRAWAGLQGLADQAWPRLKDLATSAWTGLQTRATAAWTGLQGRAIAAWTALKSTAASVVASLTSRISGIISRINGAVGRILEYLANAVASLISRVRDATSRALTFLSSRAGAAWNAVKNAGTRAWEGLKNWGTRAWQRLESLGTGAWERLKDLGTRAWTSLKELGGRIWTGLENLAHRVWDALSRAWEWLKQKMTTLWQWLKKTWKMLKSAASRMWDWLKRRAKQALEWLKRKWAWLKSMIRKGLDWLKAKWRWLKGLVKIAIRIPDQTLCKLHNTKPWKFVDIHTGRVPLAKTVVDPGIGPVELALFVQGDAVATLGAMVGPCTLKNIVFTLQPLISRYTGQADLHVPGTAFETLVLTGTIGGSANYGGLIGVVGGGLEGTGTARALGSFTAKPRFVYDSGKITTTVPIRLEFCLEPTIDLDAFLTAKLLTGKPPSGPPPSAPILPGPIPLLAAGPGAGPGKPPPEKVIKEWIARWHLARWTKRECWDVKAQFTLVSGPGGLPEVDVQFSAKPVSLSDVIRSLFDLPPKTRVVGPPPVVPPVGPSAGAPTGFTPGSAIEMDWFKHETNDYYPSPITIQGRQYRRDDSDVLPRGEPIGVPRKFWPKGGKTFQLDPNERGPAAGDFNAVLDSYGFDRSGLDADHVQDLQWGGPDEFRNLWPMDRSANRSAGPSQNDNQVITFSEQTAGPVRSITLKTMKSEARTDPTKRFFGRWFKIRTIR